MQTAIELCFTDQSLTQTTLVDKKQGIEYTKPFIKAIIDLGIKPYIWTVGDIQWQITKYQNTQISNFVPQEQFLCASKNKLHIIKQRVTQNLSPISHIFIVDDKRETITTIHNQLVPLAEENGITIHTYHMKIHDDHANPTAFMTWLGEELKRYNITLQEIELYLDMDGVVIDTDTVMNGPVTNAIKSMI